MHHYSSNTQDSSSIVPPSVAPKMPSQILKKEAPQSNFSPSSPSYSVATVDNRAPTMTTNKEFPRQAVANQGHCFRQASPMIQNSLPPAPPRISTMPSSFQPYQQLIDVQSHVRYGSPIQKQAPPPHRMFLSPQQQPKQTAATVSLPTTQPPVQITSAMLQAQQVKQVNYLKHPTLLQPQQQLQAVASNQQTRFPRHIEYLPIPRLEGEQQLNVISKAAAPTEGKSLPQMTIEDDSYNKQQVQVLNEKINGLVAEINTLQIMLIKKNNEVKHYKMLSEDMKDLGDKVKRATTMSAQRGSHSEDNNEEIVNNLKQQLTEQAVYSRTQLEYFEKIIKEKDLYLQQYQELNSELLSRVGSSNGASELSSLRAENARLRVSLLEVGQFKGQEKEDRIEEGEEEDGGGSRETIIALKSELAISDMQMKSLVAENKLLQAKLAASSQVRSSETFSKVVSPSTVKTTTQSYFAMQNRIESFGQFLAGLSSDSSRKEMGDNRKDCIRQEIEATSERKSVLVLA